jgi:hypothetical protein
MNDETYFKLRMSSLLFVSFYGARASAFGTPAPLRGDEGEGNASADDRTPFGQNTTPSRERRQCDVSDPAVSGVTPRRADAHRHDA